MKMGIYSFYDAQTSMFSLPFFHPHPAIAKRMAADLATDPQTTIGKHPEAFHLYLLGNYDDNTGGFETIQPMMVCTCASLAFAPLQNIDEGN